MVEIKSRGRGDGRGGGERRGRVVGREGWDGGGPRWVSKRGKMKIE